MAGTGVNFEKIRSFIAIEVPDEVREELLEIISALKRRGDDVKWVRAEGIHLTLKFLGNIDKNMIPSVRQAMENASEGTGPFEMEAKGLGAFPSPNRARVVWAGLEEPAGTLAEFAERVEKEMQKLGFDAEKRAFHPHLTLGRVRKGGRPGRELAELIDRNREKSFGTFATGEVVLFRSDLKPTGAVYTKLETVKLIPQPKGRR